MPGEIVGELILRPILEILLQLFGYVTGRVLVPFKPNAWGLHDLSGNVGELILRPILEILLQLFGYVTGRVLVPLFTFGRAYVEPAAKGVRIYPKWHGFHRASDGRRVVDAEMGAFLGLVFWGLLGIATYGAYRYFAP